MLELGRYNSAHPMDPRPIREAEARGDISAAVEQALLYGLELGRRAGMFGLDAVEGRKYLQRQIDNSKLSAASRKMETEIRHAEWRADMEELHSKHPSWSGRRLAMRLAENYRIAGVPDSPSFKYLENLWVKWRPRG